MRRPGRSRLVLGESDRQAVVIPSNQDAFSHQTTVGLDVVATCTSWRPAPRCSCAMFDLAWEDTPT